MTVRQTLRDRIRNSMKAELRETAFAMFLESGFDAVSIEQITEAAGVSQRTFFRYFATKEEVLVEWLDHYGPIICSAIETAPANLKPYEAVRHGLIESANVGRGNPKEMKRNRLIAALALTSPRLRAAITERRRAWEANIAGLLAKRMGVSAEDDLRPTLLAALALTTAFVGQDWNLRNAAEGRPEVNSMSAVFDILDEIFRQ